jgi:hypothetical protein
MRWRDVIFLGVVGGIVAGIAAASCHTLSVTDFQECAAILSGLLVIGAFVFRSKGH